ncbi:MAG TPA: hypothetical protein VG146_13780 [Verrucomicrobiae bacterium]|nr:hypothetical protein [Verrucomicrobiae bacterium]
MINDSDPISSYHQNIAGHRADEVQHAKVLAQRHQHPTNPLNEKPIATSLNASNGLQDLRQRNCAAMISRSNPWGDRLAEIERIDFIEREFIALKGTEQPGVRPVARAKGFHGQGLPAKGPQMSQEQRCQQSLADPRICAGDEDDFGSQSFQ